MAVVCMDRCHHKVTPRWLKAHSYAKWKSWLSRAFHLGVLQRERICARRDDHIPADLARVIENARKTVEDTLAELHDIMDSPDCVEILYGVAAEVCGKYERILTTVATNTSCRRCRSGERS